MEILNKNIEVALEDLDTSEDNKKILKSILYKEHINHERDWDADAPKEIKEIMHGISNSGEEND